MTKHAGQRRGEHLHISEPSGRSVHYHHSPAGSAFGLQNLRLVIDLQVCGPKTKLTLCTSNSSGYNQIFTLSCPIAVKSLRLFLPAEAPNERHLVPIRKERWLTASLRFAHKG